MKQKLAAMKEWTLEHGVEIVYGSLLVGGLVLTVIAARQQAAQQAQTQKELTDAFNRGARILPNVDGSYWIFESSENVA